jgi:hypothetical protein
VRVEIGEGGVAEGALWVWERPPAGAEPVWCEQVAGAQQAVENADKWMLNYRGKRWVCGYVQARGRGRIVNLGLAAGAEVALAALGAFGAAPACRSLSAGVRAALYRRAGGAEAGRVVFATNMNDCDVTARVAVERPGPARELFSGRECDAAAAEISVEVPRRGGAVVVMD